MVRPVLNRFVFLSCFEHKFIFEATHVHLQFAYKTVIYVTESVLFCVLAAQLP